MNEWNINYVSAVPLHQQLEKKIISSVKRGELKRGYTLPSIKRLSKSLALSESTTSKAYRHLIKKGILSYNKGQGYFIEGLNES